jgi:hypothetical protein
MTEGSYLAGTRTCFELRRHWILRHSDEYVENADTLT